MKLLVYLLSISCCFGQLFEIGPSRASLTQPATSSPPGTNACDTIDDTNLLAYWKLEESSGNRTDSKSTNTLADVNTVTSGTGKIGTAAQFTSANTEYLRIVGNTSLVSTGSFTIALWFKTATDQSFSGLVEKETEYKLRKYSDDKIDWQVNDSVSGAVEVFSSETIANDTWYFVVAWYDATDKKARVQVNNGTASTSAGALTNVPKAGSGNFYLGIDTSQGGFNGFIDEAFFIKRLLTSDEKTALYNSGSGCRPSTL